MARAELLIPVNLMPAKFCEWNFMCIFVSLIMYVLYDISRYRSPNNRERGNSFGV